MPQGLETVSFMRLPVCCTVQIIWKAKVFTVTQSACTQSNCAKVYALDSCDRKQEQLATQQILWPTKKYIATITADTRKKLKNVPVRKVYYDMQQSPK
mmetsp:Transcript_30506/g.53806  ORF Transcript_30506/g.53806 Transcript_30506/m.53806 type:complete len:98 (-) Transcript_30506:13-306(-)